MTITKRVPVKRATGIPGLDEVTAGGLPAGRVTLVVGTPGAGKTILCSQFLAAGILELDEPGVYVTFEEAPADLMGNVDTFGWDIEGWIAQGKWAFVDAASHPSPDTPFSGDWDLGPLITRIEHAVNKVGAKRVVLDAITSALQRFPDAGRLRSEFRRIAEALRELGVTTVATAERAGNVLESLEYARIEDFVADNVVILRNSLDAERRRRTVEILKLRGGPHLEGQYPFTIMPSTGITVLPLSSLNMTSPSTMERVSSGSPELDAMCGGGFYRESIVMVSGATGTGKTLTTTHFIQGGAAMGEKSLLLAYEESRDQLFRNATGWGFDFASLESQGRLKVHCAYPEAMSLQNHLIRLSEHIDEFEPDRIAIDSLSALERAAGPQAFREFVIALTALVKSRQITTLLTNSTQTLTGGASITEQHTSTLTDTIILLRYVEMLGAMRRGITVLKMRGSLHDKEIREFSIDDRGMHIGSPFANVSGILTGQLTHVPTDEVDRMRELFDGDGPLRF